ncbi:MAG: alpha/beta fold hydrolase [Abditibacteriaceae bacterium]
MMTYQEVLSRGFILRGMMHRPQAAPAGRRLPAVVLCHGFTGTRVEPHQLLVKAANALTEAGIIAVRFDFAGSGESDGEFVNMTPETEVQDAINILQWLGAQSGVDRSKIGMIGLSLGGLVTACAASRTKLPAAIALWSATAHMGDRMKERATLESSMQLQEKGCIDLKGNLVGREFLENALQINPLQEAKQYDGKVLIVHGTADQSVPVSEAKEYAEAFAQCQPTLHMIPDADHTFNSQNWEAELIKTTTEWMKKYLSAEPC